MQPMIYEYCISRVTNILLLLFISQISGFDDQDYECTPKSQLLPPLIVTPLSSPSIYSIKKPKPAASAPSNYQEKNYYHKAAPSPVQVQVSPNLEQKIQEEDAATVGLIAPTGPSLLSAPPPQTLSGKLSILVTLNTS